jgi:hypothetical protein
MSKFMGGFASFWIVFVGLALIFSAGPVIGCLTIVGIGGPWAYITFSDRIRDAHEATARLADALEQIAEEGYGRPKEIALKALGLEPPK